MAGFIVCVKGHRLVSGAVVPAPSPTECGQPGPFVRRREVTIDGGVDGEPLVEKPGCGEAASLYIRAGDRDGCCGSEQTAPQA